ncbi:PTS system IIB component, Glc family /PTS system IIC component, Glc family [Seinonella peptonophila]|uniref:PTS system IIB component, Glc family /PTS system IIC component, Glc family n=1 Tax=Seinonella peptonophila TaxID=112248 RepID=A0A1M4SY85_9BACL|nr:PTS transporter subunit EIIC [Seinonella peptonophila]SHE37149.1 PTS system IIB component, Glc family /PTS system IIC component, Glc family [Seinonella peptonophila]
MKTDDHKLADQIMKYLGGKKNIKELDHCMTRLRVKVFDPNQVHDEVLKKTQGVLGVVIEDGFQIVLGPKRVNNIFSILINRVDQQKFIPKKSSGVANKDILSLFSRIFVPIIPALIASGLTIGISKSLPQLMDYCFQIEISKYPLIEILNLSGSVLFAYITILVGYFTAKELGATPVLGAIIGGFIIHPSISELHLFHDHLLSPGSGGIFSAMLAVFCFAQVEKFMHKRLPSSLDPILTPTFALLFTACLTYLVIMPACGLLAKGLTHLIMFILHFGGWVAGFIISATFLPLVVAGFHQGFYPIHLELIHQLGKDPLFPIQAMGGAGQIGAAFAILHKTKQENLKKAIYGALPVGLFGIGEPLLYGVMLPLGRPFLTACIGGGFGGAIVSWWKVASYSIGVSGLSLFPLIDHGVHGMIGYALGLITAYMSGYLFTYFYGFQHQMENQFQS